MRTKVLLIGPSYFKYNQSIASAFDPDRFEVRIIDYSDQFGQINLHNKIAFFFPVLRITTTRKQIIKLNRKINATYHEYRPDIVFIIKGDSIFEETISHMKSSKNVLWMLDGIDYYPQSIKLLDKMDAVFLFEKTDVEKVRRINKNAFYLPPSFDDHIFRNLHLEKDIDILFIGTLYDSRVKTLEKLHQQFPKLKLKVYCKRYWFYKTPLKYIKSLTDNIFINRFVTPAEANVLYNRAKVCLNMHHGQSVYGINPRFFEILGANALQFVDYKPFIDEYFPDSNIHVYKTEEELFKMIHQHFIGNILQEDQNLYDTVSKYHTYKNRVEYILGKV
jgi:spore maturation protein CgeB